MTTNIDWPQILQDMAYLLGEPDELAPHLQVPCGTRKMAEHLSVGREVVRRWLDGTEPRHADGEMLLDRWVSLTGKAREFAPRDRTALSAARMR